MVKARNGTSVTVQVNISTWNMNAFLKPLQTLSELHATDCDRIQAACN
jgi:hypothetical protein